MGQRIEFSPTPKLVEGLNVTRTAILLLIARYGYVTNRQLAYRRGSVKSESFYRTHTAAMERDGLLLRLYLPREQPGGQGRAVFTLAARGRRFLTGIGVEAPGRYRPREERRKSGSLPLLHSLAVTDWTVAQDKLCEAYPAVQERDFVSERELTVEPLAVEIRRGQRRSSRETVRFAPDGWYSLALDMGPGFEFSYFVELDRSSEYQRQIRRRIAAYLAAAASQAVRERFSPSMTVAIVAPNDPRRARTLLDWIEVEISATTATERECLERADIFRVTSGDSAWTDPLELFFGPGWGRPFDRRLTSLIPEPAAQVTGGDRC